LEMVKCFFSRLSLQRLRLQTLFDPSLTKPPMFYSNNITKVLTLLSFSTLIISDGFVRTPHARRLTTSQVLNPSNSAHFL
jgi:hypothetical protein